MSHDNRQLMALTDVSLRRGMKDGFGVSRRSYGLGGRAGVRKMVPMRAHDPVRRIVLH